MFFCNLSPLDVVNTPLQHLQWVRVDRDAFWKLVSAVNSACTNPLGQSILKDSFDTRWPKFEKAFKEIKFEGEAAALKTETVEERLSGSGSEPTGHDERTNTIRGVRNWWHTWCRTPWARTTGVSYWQRIGAAWKI